MRDYQEAVSYLEELATFGWKPGLERIRRLLALLGNPERELPCIHVGGTNGKGSVTVTLATLLARQGYQVGQFISPEIYDIRERISINGQWIPEEDLTALLDPVRQAEQQMLAEGGEGPTNFEVWTALAFLWFRKMKVDLAVIEVGLGGEIDSTNVIIPLVSVITNVSIDHKDYLGETEEEIAAVKSGIIKKNRPVVTGTLHAGALRVLEERARKEDAPIYRFGIEFQGLEKGFSESRSAFFFQNPDMEEEVSYSLVGHHQVINGSMALQTLWLLSRMGYALDMPQAIRDMESVFWAGRLELIEKGDRRILLDAAHNLEGARNLALALRDIYSYRHLILLVGILADKERGKMIDYLGPFGDKVIITRPNNPRAGDFRGVAQYFQPYKGEVILEEDPERALALGLSLAGAEDLLCITGSIYMLKEIRRLLKEDHK